MDPCIIHDLYRYYSLWRETNALYETWAKQHGISYYELLVLFSLLEKRNACTQKQLCLQWQLPKQTVNSILQHLLRREYVRFVPLEQDRRSKVILFTPKGETYAREIIEALQEQEARVWAKLGKKRRAAFLEYTALYNQFFQEEAVYANHA